MFPTNNSPRYITPQAGPRLPMVIVQSQPTVVVTRPTVQNLMTQPPVISTPSAPTTAPTSVQAATSVPVRAASASGSKDHPVFVKKTDARYGIMEFASGITIDVKDGNTVEMRREINPYTYRAPTATEGDAAANTITTSLGVVLPKTGAGSEYGREQKEALKRKRYATKGTNLEDLPWTLTNRLASEKKLKHYRGMKKGGITANSSYYVFIQNKDSFEAYPVEDWYSFTPTKVYKTLDFDEAEKQFQDRNKVLSKWHESHKPTKGKDTEDDGESHKEKGKKTKRDDFKLLDTDEWGQDHDEDDEEDDDDDDEDNDDKGKKGGKGKKKSGKKSKDKNSAVNLSDDDEEDEARANVKRQKAKRQKTDDEPQGEDSDDGDHENDEIDYTSDETSDEEDEIRDANTVKTSMKYEVKGIDEEMKTIPDISKKLEQMDENGEGIDFDDTDDEETAENEDNDDDNGKGGANDDLSDVGKLLKNDVVSKEIESSSDDDFDDSDDPDKDTMEPTTSNNTQPIPSEQIKTEKGHKKAREEEMRAIKSKVMSLPTPSSMSTNPSDKITEETVRNLLLQKQHMTSSELIQRFLPKAENLRTQETKDGIVKKLAVILKRLNIEEKTINGKRYIKLKT